LFARRAEDSSALLRVWQYMDRLSRTYGNDDREARCRNSWRLVDRRWRYPTCMAIGGPHASRAKKKPASATWL